MQKTRFGVIVNDLRLGRLEEEITGLAAAGCDELHVLVGDGRFGGTFGMGEEIVRAIKGFSRLPVAVNLAVEQPEKHIERFAKAGCKTLYVPLEPLVHGIRVVTEIRENGMAPGMSVEPATPLSKLEYVLGMVDRILLRSTESSDGRQVLRESAIERAGILRNYIRYQKAKAQIDVVGPFNATNAAQFVKQGAQELVLGETQLRGASSSAAALETFRKAIAAEAPVA